MCVCVCVCVYPKREKLIACHSIAALATFTWKEFRKTLTSVKCMCIFQLAVS